MKKDSSEVVATSSDLCDVDQTILILNDEKNIVINSKKRVAIYSLAKEKHIKDVLETEVVEDIWSTGPDSECFYAMCSTGHQLSVCKVQVPTGKILQRIKVHQNISIPDNMVRIKAKFDVKITDKMEEEEEVYLKSVYFVTKKGQSSLLSAQQALTGKKLMFGNVFHWDANSEIVVKVKKAVSGQPDFKLEVTGTNGSSLWSRKLTGNQKNRPITCLRCPQTKDKFFASGDESGRVRIWKGENQYSDGHWHSLPIEALEFSLDSTHILSGGGEGVIVKWDVKSMRKLCVVPRIGTNLTNISLSYAKILACTANNNIKIFTSNLEDEGGIIGFSTLATSNKMIWHQDSTSLVLIGPTNHHLQFFDPLERRQKFALEIISQNIILGEREDKIPINELVDFDLISGSSWIATLEKTWDKQNSLKFWQFKSDNNHREILLKAKFHNVNGATKIKFIQDWALLTFSAQDKCVQLWVRYENQDKWHLAKVFKHLNKIPIDAASTKDETLLAIAFEDLVILYDMGTLEPLSFLGSKHVDQPYTSLTFRSRYLICGNQVGLFIWDLIQLKLIGKFDTKNAEILGSEDHNKVYIKTDEGIFHLNSSSMQTSKLFDATCNIQAGTIAHHERIYFIEKDSSKTNQLRFFSTNLEKPNVNHVINQKSEELEDFNNIKASLDELKVTVNENIYHARQAPPIDPEMITKKLSLCSESVIKSALPL